MSTFHSKTALLLGFLLSFPALIGCANGFSSYYHSIHEKPFEKYAELIPHTGVPELRHGQNKEEEHLALFESCYWMIGYSSFQAGYHSPYAAEVQAKRVKAAIVLITENYSHTVSQQLFQVPFPDECAA